MKKCSKCKQIKPLSEFYKRKKFRWKSEEYYSYCKECVKQRGSEYYYANIDLQRKKARENRAKRLPEVLARQKATRLERRMLVVSKYGGKCVCCGESSYEFLAVDHINGGGKAHRKSIGGSHRFMKWLIDNNFPDGFRILCHNCNMAIGIYGRCPHEIGTASN